MAQSQLLAIHKQGSKFDIVDITVNESMTISICEDLIKIKQKDINGRNKSCLFSKTNWFELMNFTDIINSFFLLKYEKKTQDEETNSNDDIKTYTRHENKDTKTVSKMGKHEKVKSTTKKHYTHKFL